MLCTGSSMCQKIRYGGAYTCTVLLVAYSENFYTSRTVWMWMSGALSIMHALKASNVMPVICQLPQSLGLIGTR